MSDNSIERVIVINSERVLTGVTHFKFDNNRKLYESIYELTFVFYAKLSFKLIYS
jgi:hypothetical protein